MNMSRLCVTMHAALAERTACVSVLALQGFYGSAGDTLFVRTAE